MQNPILARLQTRLGVAGPAAEMDPAWLLTLLSVLEVERYTLDEWNGALSAVLGRNILCPSYRSLTRYLQRTVLGVE